MQLLSTWREYEVMVVRGLDEPYVIDEQLKKILIRRSILRPWAMLKRLLDAINAAAGRDKQWALRTNGKGTVAFADTVTIAGETWTVLGCPVLMENDGSIATQLKPFVIDHEDRTIRMNTRVSMSMAAPSLIQAINDIFADRAMNALEGIDALFAGSDEPAAVAA